jgi:nitroreductase
VTDGPRHPDLTSNLFEAIRTLHSVRRFRPDPVPEGVLRDIIDAATRAPSARNAQPWYFLAVRDPEPKRQIAALYRSAWRRAREHTAATDADADIKGRAGYAKMMEAVDELADHLDCTPVLILACLDTAQLGPLADGAGHILGAQSAYASIFPAVQNLMLAARGFGLGSTLTTVYAGVEAEIRAVVGIPPRVHIAALVPVGYPIEPFRATKRKPVDAVAFLDRWGREFGDQ